MRVQCEFIRGGYFLSLIHPMQLRWARLFTGLLLLLSFHVAAGDLVVAREQWTDSTGQLTAEEVSTANFTAAPEFVTRGYTAEVIWLRLHVKASPENPAGPVMLRVRPTILDSVQLWVPDAQSHTGWRMRASGDRQPFSSSDRSYGTLGFVVFPEASGSHYLDSVSTANRIEHIFEQALRRHTI